MLAELEMKKINCNIYSSNTSKIFRITFFNDYKSNMALILGNGKIDFREFVNMMILNGEQIAWNENDLVEAFRTFDTENKGKLMLDWQVLILSSFLLRAIDKNNLEFFMTYDMISTICGANGEGHRSSPISSGYSLNFT